MSFDHHSNFPPEYKKFTKEELMKVICLSCGRSYGEHSWDRCWGNALVFKAPRLQSPKGNRLK